MIISQSTINSDATLVGIVLVTIALLLTITSFIFSQKANLAIQQHDPITYNDERLLNVLNTTLWIFAIVSIVAYISGKSSAVIIPFL